jgi:subtilisin family serine protease
MGRIKCRSYLALLWCFIGLSAFAQKNKYFIELTDKNNSPYSLSVPQGYLSPRAIERRLRQNISINQSDLPVNPAYIQAIRQTGAEVWYTSRWMNAVLIEADSAILAAIRQLPFVKLAPSGNWKKVNARQSSNKKNASSLKSESNARINESLVPVLDYGFSANQIRMIGADDMHQQGYTGKDMWVAIIDAGFRNANQIASLKHVFDSNRILGTYDFVDKETSVYEDDSHGLQVFSAMAAHKPGEIIGTAFDANYLLLRTEKSGSESRIEEINWLLAAEYADSIGVDVINSSLGYNLFDDPAMSYRRTDMDGNTALVTRAADRAAAAGILVVTSAGNEGDDPWQTIAAPADADSVLTVGAVNVNGLYAPFSSRGPSADKRIKPNLVAQGQGAVLSSPAGGTISSNGTSFSSPILAGMATSFWQAYPQLTNMQVIDILQRSASQANSPDSLLGYGIPNFTKASQIATNELKISQEAFRFYPNPVSENSFTLWVNPSQRNIALTIRIFDTTGKLISQQSIASAVEKNIIYLNSALFPASTYLIQVTSPTLRFTDKFVKY